MGSSFSCGMHIHLAEGTQGVALSSCFSPGTVNECPFHNVLSHFCACGDLFKIHSPSPSIALKCHIGFLSVQGL